MTSDRLTHPHLFLLLSECFCINGRRGQLAIQRLRLTQPGFEFLVRLPEPRHQHLSLLQSREPLSMTLIHCFISST